MATYQILGINDDESYCTLCGKVALKRVVWMENTETNEINCYGTCCAAKLVLGKKTKSNSDRVFKFAQTMDAVKKWKENGFDVDKIARGIWNVFGFLTDKKNGNLFVDFNGEMIQVA